MVRFLCRTFFVVQLSMTKSFLLNLYRVLMRIRMSQEKIIELYPEGEMKCPTHLCVGEEAISTGVCAGLKPEDQIVSFYRSHGHFLAKGGDMKKLFAELYGRSTGALGGRGGSMLLCDLSVGDMGSSALVGGGISIATGLAFAAKYKKERRVTISFFGDAAVEEGVFHESMNFSALHKLPIVYVCENNGYAVMTALHKRQPMDSIYKHARVYHMPGVRVDGNDVLAVYRAALRAINRARSGNGPTLLECKTHRIRGHIESFIVATEHRTAREVIEARRKDPVPRFRRLLLKGDISRRDLNIIEEELHEEILQAVSFAKASAFPVTRTLLDHVYPKVSTNA